MKTLTSKPKIITFDCFGTVFNMEGFPKETLREYARTVRRTDTYIPYSFAEPEWGNLRAHPDSAEAITRLQHNGFYCVAMSNGSKDLLMELALLSGFSWSNCIDLQRYSVYKSSKGAWELIRGCAWYYSNVKAEEILHVTANPDFGDIEMAKSVGFQTAVVRQGLNGDYWDLKALADHLISWKEKGGD